MTEPLLLEKCEFDDEVRDREPDLGFWLVGAEWPCIVLEIGDSENYEDLRFSAYEYLTRTENKVNFVLV